MEHILPTFGVIVVGLIFAFFAFRRYDALEQRMLVFALVGHMASAWIQVWITEDYYGGGDMLNYEMYGRELARAMEVDFGTMAIENLKLAFQLPSEIPVDVMGAGTSSGTMSAITGFLLLGLGGSLYAVCMAITFLAFFGNLALYKVFREEFPEGMRARLLFGTMLVPSTIFWSSGILKEAIAIGGLGWMFLGVHRVLRFRLARGIVLIAIGTTLVWLTKPYILFPFILAAAVWGYSERALRTGGATFIVRPVYFVLAAAVAAASVAALGAIFPSFALDHLAEETARYQQIGLDVRGNSSFEMGDPAARGFGGQLAWAPLALVSSLFRPFFFEVRTALMLVSAIEMTALLVLFLRTVWTQSWAGTLSRIRNSPLLTFSAVFTLLFGVAVGLATTNLGTLARYRMPMLPFYVAAILVLSAPRPLPEDEDDENEATANDGELART